MGDPSYEYEHTDVRRIRDGDEYTEEEVTVSSNLSIPILLTLSNPPACRFFGLLADLINRWIMLQSVGLMLLI